MTKIVLFVVLMIPGHQSVTHSAPMESVAECLQEAAEILKNAPPDNGSLQAGCVSIGEKTTSGT